MTRVVAAMQDPNPQVAGRGLYKLQQAGVEVRHGLMLAEAEAVNLGFLKRMRTGFPYVQLKLGASLDGRTAIFRREPVDHLTRSASGRSAPARAERRHLSTSATVLADDPSLTVRWDELDAETQRLYPRDNLRQPLRILLDSQNRITPQHRVVQQPGATWLARLQADAQTAARR